MTRQHNLTTLVTAVAILVSLFSLPLVAAEGADGVVNVNTADASELQLLPRVGPAVAQRILEFREENGAFKSKEDLMLVRGIGESTYEQLAPYVALEGPTTLAEKVRIPRQEPAGAEG